MREQQIDDLTLEERQAKVREAIEAMRTPSDAELMTIAIQDIKVAAETQPSTSRTLC